MPELPEVETIVRQINKVIVGKTVADVFVYRKKSFVGDPKDLVRKTVTKASRKGKVILLHFKTLYPIILIHLKMTGQLIYVGREKRVAGGHPSLDWVAKLPNKYTRVELTFKNEGSLFFNDLRVFGWLKVVTSQEQLEEELKNVSGIEPLTDDFTPQSLVKIFARSGQPIKIVIMDQKKIAGIGNIYANDALWDAKIDPQRPAKSLSKQEVARLHQSINKVIALGIKYGGTSQKDYKQLLGEEGDYQYHFLAYKREGEPCQRCQNPIAKIHLGGRGTYLCRFCQK